MTAIRIRRHEITLLPESARVIIRPFIPANAQCVGNILSRVLALSEEEVQRELLEVHAAFGSRHLDIEGPLLAHFGKVQRHIDAEQTLSRERQLLIGALFSGEYALESTALFNPSIVPHPDQKDVPEGSLRFIMSLRATGEGHISSIEFRVGVITHGGDISIDHVSRFVTVPDLLPNPRYRKKPFIAKLHEMGFDNVYAAAVMTPLEDRFSRSDLKTSMLLIGQDSQTVNLELQRTLECILWLADSNYELSFSSKLALSERIIFPVSANESNGIEDARFVRFTDDDGTVTYYATYTAYNGREILPQLIETQDFLHFRVLTLNGSAAKNKGMALFPRRVNGRYAMLSRQDDENLFIMYSDSPYRWTDPQPLLSPVAGWESVKIGNCGSPLETKDGWLLLTHGVGPMRTYCIGAALLDLNDPTRVIGRLREPLISPEVSERDGYVPNVVYSCGSLIHGRQLILPYAVSDKATVVASVVLDDLLTALKSSPPAAAAGR